MKAYRHMMTTGGGIRLLAHRLKLKTVIAPMLVIAVMAASAPRAEALLLPGTTGPVGPLAFPGGLEEDSIFHDNTCFAGAGTICDVGASVLTGTDTGTLDFYYQVTNESAQNEVHRLTGTSFEGFDTEVWWILDGASVPCSACGGFFVDGSQAPEDADRDGFGQVVGFNFPLGFQVDPGETSRVLLIRTNATKVVPGFVSAINGGAQTEDAFAPGVTPEPASLLLFGLGLLGTAAAIRRKRKV